MYLRLRQLCLVVSDLDRTVDSLCTVFGAAVCFRDPAVERFGLRNALIRIGVSFIEIVSPVQPGTTAGRYLQRRGGDGGYMVILDSDALDHWREQAEVSKVRIALDYHHGGFSGLQLHPADTGGALLEINRTTGGGEMTGAYGPAGQGWQLSADARYVSALAGAVLQSPDHEGLARRWSEILRRPVKRSNEEYVLRLDYGYLRFVRAVDGRGEGLAGMDLCADGPTAVRAVAEECGCVSDVGHIVIGGVQLCLTPKSDMRQSGGNP